MIKHFKQKFSWESEMDLHFRLVRILIRSLSFWSVGLLTDAEQTPGTKIHCRYKNSKMLMQWFFSAFKNDKSGWTLHPTWTCSWQRQTRHSRQPPPPHSPASRPNSIYLNSQRWKGTYSVYNTKRCIFKTFSPRFYAIFLLFPFLHFQFPRNLYFSFFPQRPHSILHNIY